jgi:hypothetical protein
MTKAQLTAQLEQLMDDYEAVARAYDHWHYDRTQMAATYHRLDAEVGFLRQQNPALAETWAKAVEEAVAHQQAKIAPAVKARRQMEDGCQLALERCRIVVREIAARPPGIFWRPKRLLSWLYAASQALLPTIEDALFALERDRT